MGIFADLLPEFRTAPTYSAKELFERFLGIDGETDSGESVTPANAMKFSAVYACVNVLGQSIGQLPWDVYQRTGEKTKTIARNRTEQWLLHNEPNNLMCSASFRSAGMANALLSGSWYTEIVRDRSMRVKFLRLLPWWNVQVQHQLNDPERIIYLVTRPNGVQEKLESTEVIHVPCLSLDGSCGLSPIAQHRQSIGLGLAAERAGASFFGNGLRASGLFKSKLPLKKEQRGEIAESYKEFMGSKNFGKAMVVGGDIDFQQLTIPPADAQFLETREYQLADIARIYRVPGVLLGLNDKTSTFAASEQFFLSFVKFTLTPWVQVIEQEFNRKLFPNSDEYYCKLDLNGLLRGDTAARAEFYNKLFNVGAITQNDIRALEDMDPIEGGDRAYVQQNLMPVDMVDEVLKAKAAPPPDPQPTPSPKKPARNSAHVSWMRDVVGRVSQWERKETDKIAKALHPVFRSLKEAEKCSASVEAYCETLANELRDGVPEDFEELAVAQFIDGVQKEPVINVTVNMPQERKESKSVTFKRSETGEVIGAEVTEA